MKIFRLILASLLLVATMMPAAAQKLSLGDLSGYLNDMKTAQADFTQINDDGTISTGRLYIRRPGRVRFEYNPPEESLVMANGGQVAIFDAKSNQPPQRFPLARTPLSLILARSVDLAREKMVVGHTWDETTTTVRAQDPAKPEYGSIEMVFTGEPIELRQWVVLDGSGQRTTVILGELVTGGAIGLNKFSIRAEMSRRGF